MILNLTDQQAQSMMQLADAAVRAGGLQFARQAVMLMDLMDAAASSEPTPTTSKDLSHA